MEAYVLSSSKWSVSSRWPTLKPARKIVVGTIVIRGPSSNMAPSALAELTSGVELFEKASQHAEWAKRTHVRMFYFTLTDR